MEHNRENGNRGGHPGGDVPCDGQKGNAALHFEGMNYEQRREPYFTKRQANRNSDLKNASGTAEHDLDGRSPI
jgi:hypothetical protein